MSAPWGGAGRAGICRGRQRGKGDNKGREVSCLPKKACPSRIGASGSFPSKGWSCEHAEAPNAGRPDYHYASWPKPGNAEPSQAKQASRTGRACIKGGTKPPKWRPQPPKKGGPNPLQILTREHVPKAPMRMQEPRSTRERTGQAALP
jgi:hypothetical protein